MNNQRRKELDNWMKKLDDLKEELDQIATDEQVSLYNLPENLQNSQRGDAIQDAADKLNDALGLFDDIVDYIEDAIYG